MSDIDYEASNVVKAAMCSIRLRPRTWRGWFFVPILWPCFGLLILMHSAFRYLDSEFSQR